MVIRQAVIGIDVGTSGTKAVLVDCYGHTVRECVISYSFDVPVAGWAEQDPSVWWDATTQAVSTLMREAQLDNQEFSIEGISLTGQMHGLVCLDENAVPIRKAILWCDLRSHEEAMRLEEQVGRETVCTLTQNPPLPNFTLTKLLWLKEHEPTSFDRIATFLLPKDYIRFLMTGVIATEPTDASGTLLFDVEHRTWSKEMARLAGIPVAWLPQVVESTALVGTVTKEASQLLYVPEGTKVFAGAGDQAAGALGIGVLQEGGLSVSLGTSGVVLAPTKEPVRDPNGALHTFCHVAPQSWYVMGVTQAAGGSLKWFRDRLRKEVSYDSIMDDAATCPPGAQGLLFLPYLMGERSPLLDPLARGAWIGLQWQHTDADMARALVEGVSFSLLDCLRRIEALGIVSEDVKLTGGGADGPLWVQILGAVLKQPIRVLRGSQGPAYGAAILAAIGANMIGWDEVSDFVADMSAKPVAYNTSWAMAYEPLFSLYQQAYRDLRQLYVSIDEWVSNNKT